MASTMYMLPQITIRLPDDPEQPGREFYVAGPKYFDGWSEFYTGDIPDRTWALLPYGYAGACLIVVQDILPASAAFLAAQADVAEMDIANLDASLGADRDVIAALLESFNMPTNWTTPSTSYRELLRYLNGISVFSREWWRRYIRLTGNNTELWDLVTPDDRWNQLGATEQAIFEDVIAAYGYPDGISGNPTFRFMIRTAGDTFAGTSFTLGGVTV